MVKIKEFVILVEIWVVLTFVKKARKVIIFAKVRVPFHCMAVLIIGILATLTVLPQDEG